MVRNLEIIGEAVKNLSPRLREANPEIPWKQIAGMRDKMIHEYFGVNLQLVFEVIRLELSNLQQRVEAMLEALPEQP